MERYENIYSGQKVTKIGKSLTGLHITYERDNPVLIELEDGTEREIKIFTKPRYVWDATYKKILW